jgi:uncharacterized tellurite resistance protein B-like protein
MHGGGTQNELPALHFQAIERRRRATFMAAVDGCLTMADRRRAASPNRNLFSAIRRKDFLMLNKLRQFIAEVTSPLMQDNRTFDEADYRLAAAALLIHVISLDGAPSEIEKRKLRSLLEARFQLDSASAGQLIAAATRMEGEAVDLYHFTSVIMRSVDEAGRIRIVEMMWELVYADGHVSEFEDNVVWRAADLLAVSSRDRIDLKHRVAQNRPVPDTAT